MPGRYIRGALIEFKPALLIPVPNVIVFQYNPEAMTSSWSASGIEHSAAGQAEGNALALGSDPVQEFSFTISMDAGDTVADENNAASDLASVYGIYPRLAALEALMFASGPAATGLAPAGTSGCDAASALPGTQVAGSLLGGVKRQVPAATVPAVLFVWGLGRILPVRVTSLRVTEKLYDKFLIPTHADAELGLRVLTDSDIRSLDRGLIQGILKTAYYTMQVQRQTLSIENSLDPLIGLIPPL
jgi:hypothetical protein